MTYIEKIIDDIQYSMGELQEALEETPTEFIPVDFECYDYYLEEEQAYITIDLSGTLPVITYRSALDEYTIHWNAIHQLPDGRRTIVRKNVFTVNAEDEEEAYKLALRGIARTVESTKSMIDGHLDEITYVP